MARVDYYKIGTDIEAVLKDDPTLSDVLFQRTSDPFFSQQDHVQILLRRRDAPERMQGINASTRTRYLIRYSLICWAYGLDPDAVEEARDDLVGRVEIALQKNYAELETRIGPNWFTGGNFYSNDDPIFRGAEIEFVVDKSAVL